MLDFDGVLSPLVADPEAARADADCLEALPAGWRVAVVSGRSCDDVLRRLAPYRPDAVVGDHGLEIRVAGGPSWVHPVAARLRDRVVDAARALGGRIEVKGLTAKAYGGAAGEPPAGVRYLAGRGGVDVLPAVDWDKGRACAWLLDAWRWSGETALYIGDEATDEEAFRRLGPRGVLTVRVAPDGPTAAARTLPDQSSVAPFLRSLAGR
jgi:trehalose 6-phosphate phosphatase